MEVIAQINEKIKEFLFIDIKVFSFHNDELVLGLNEDLAYSHRFEIRFRNVFTIDCNINWTIDTKRDMIRVVDTKEINLKYGVEIGNLIFELNDQDGRLFYIIAEEISFTENTVKYY
jgi:hypothetical protein